MRKIDTLEKLVETLHPERAAHPFVAPRIFALIGTPETSAQPIEPGQRRECIVGDRVRFFVAGAANQTRWMMLRAPAAHTGGISPAGDWTPTTPGLYLVAIELDGWSRVLAFVALPADAATELASTNGRRGAEWRHVFRGVLCDPRCTDESITRSLESDSPSWRTLLGTSGIDLRHFGA